MTEYKSPLSLRGEWLSCPLPLALDSYWSCEADCLHCVARRLNRTWGHDQRITNPDSVRRKLVANLRRRHSTPLAQALHAKKVIMIGRKTDPYQPIEIKQQVTRRLIEIMIELEWPFIIHSKYLSNALRDTDLLFQSHGLATVLCDITVGGEEDWEMFERKRTTPVHRRLRILQRWQKKGLRVGVRGEPFIPGHHTPTQFRWMCRRLKEHGLVSYNTYNLHMNDYTLKRLHNAGLDISRIWTFNQDERWRPIQQKLCDIAYEEGIRLGCPDFVNTGPQWKSCTNTCCGVDVPGAFTFNTHQWKRLLQNGLEPKKIFRQTYEHIGSRADREQARNVIEGKPCPYYTMWDAGL